MQPTPGTMPPNPTALGELILGLEEGIKEKVKISKMSGSYLKPHKFIFAASTRN